MAYRADAAYRVQYIVQTGSGVFSVEPNQGKLMEKVAFFHQIFDPADGRAARPKPDYGRDGRRALRWSLIALIFYPLGGLGMYFGARGWKMGKRKRGLAIASFILGTLEVCATLFILSVALIVG